MRIPDHQKLEQLSEWAANYQEAQLLAGLTCVKKKITIGNLTDEIHKVIAEVSIYYRMLDTYSINYCYEYATDDNDCFSSDKERFANLRSSYNALRNVVLSLCPRSPRMAYNYLGERVTYSNPEHSYFCNSTATQLDMYGRESFPDDVQQLCQAFDKLFTLLQESEKLCINVQQDVEQIRMTPRLCWQIYNECYDVDVQRSSDIIKLLPREGIQDLHDRFQEERDKGVPEEELIPLLYHRLTTKEYHNHTICNELKKARLQGLQDEEALLFSEMTPNRVIQIRHLIKDFDKVGYKKRGNTLASECVAFLAEWLQIGEQQARLFYQYFKKNYSGGYSVPTYQAMMKTYNEKLGKGNKKGREGYEAFVKKIKETLPHTTISDKVPEVKQSFSSGILYALS